MKKFFLKTRKPEGMNKEIVIMNGLEKKNVLDAIRVVTDQNIGTEIANNYNNEILVVKVVRIILSYTRYINRTVWKRY